MNVQRPDQRLLETYATVNAYVSALEAEVERLTSALVRLGSMQAFGYSRAVVAHQDDELMERINYARAAVGKDAPR